MISCRFDAGSTPAMLLSLGRLVFWATVAATRLTLTALRQTVFFCIGFWLGYRAVTREKPS